MLPSPIWATRNAIWSEAKRLEAAGGIRNAKVASLLFGLGDVLSDATTAACDRTQMPDYDAITATVRAVVRNNWA